MSTLGRGTHDRKGQGTGCELSPIAAKARVAGMVLVVLGLGVMTGARFMVPSALILTYASGGVLLACGSYALAITSIIQGKRLGGYAHLAITTATVAAVLYMAMRIISIVTPER